MTTASHRPQRAHSMSWQYQLDNSTDSFPIATPRLIHPQDDLANADLSALVQSPQFTFQHHPQTAPQSTPDQQPYTAQTNQHHAQLFDITSQDKRRSESFASTVLRKNSTNQIRRRTSRACDQCNQLRTKCDGRTPCGHCVDTRLTCEYARTRKKRGKVSKKDLAEQAAAAGSDGTLPSAANTAVQHARRDGQGQDTSPEQNYRIEHNGDFQIPQGKSTRNRSQSMPDGAADHGMPEVPFDNSPQQSSVDNTSEFGGTSHQLISNGMVNDGDEHYSAVDLNSFMPGVSVNQMSRHRLDSMHSLDISNVYDVNITGLQDQTLVLDPFNFSMDSPSALMNEGMHGVRSPGGVSQSNGGSVHSGNSQPTLSGAALKYPVLQPLLPHIRQVMSQSLASELLEHYFASSSSAHPHPASPYLLGFIFSKRSFLKSAKARECSPALLASMLWIAARTSDARALTSPPSARGRLCQKLLNLSISLLKPLIHGSVAGKAVSGYPGRLIINGSALGGDGVIVDHVTPEKIAAGTLDDVACYTHIAIVVSASEDKSASLRWWTAAWALAKELKLGRELAPNAQSRRAGAQDQEEALLDSEDQMELDPNSIHVTEEQREERRRLWWVLYIVDRHLALCYNRPLHLLERECEGLLRPMDERAWQSGNFPPASEASFSPGSQQKPGSRFEFTGPSIFGYFLPLMTILGEVVDLHQARQHPLLRFMPGDAQHWDSQFQVQHIITQQLEAYDRSMQAYAAQHLPLQTGFGGDGGETGGRAPHMTEAQIHLKIAIAYSTHIMHVLHILATGKWDPISLLDDNDLWISSPSFVTAIGHAVNGAEAVTDILKYDPEINFMPFLYGIYLLQGSFLLLLIADKLQGDASTNVVLACETIVRAHEACVVTLQTDYQRAFRKVMQSALAQVRGRVPEDAGEQQRRRRETLALYRWTGDGTGLAI